MNFTELPTAYCYIDQYGTIIEKNDGFDYIMKGGPNGTLKIDNNIINNLNFKDLSWESTMKYSHLLCDIYNAKSVNDFKTNSFIKLLITNDHYGEVYFVITDYIEGKGIYGILLSKDKKQIILNNNTSDESHLFQKLKQMTNDLDLKVAVIDDSITSCKMIQNIFKKQKIECDIFTEPIQILKDYSMIIVDIFMPGINGLEFCAQFKLNKKTSNSNCRIIAISGDMNDTLITEVMQAGFDGFIPKPVTLDNIQSMIYSSVKL